MSQCFFDQPSAEGHHNHARNTDQRCNVLISPNTEADEVYAKNQIDEALRARQKSTEQGVQPAGLCGTQTSDRRFINSPVRTRSKKPSSAINRKDS